ncbi:hypothetical protein JCM5350_003017 [Sporobolomyces pararoseus]
MCQMALNSYERRLSQSTQSATPRSPPSVNPPRSSSWSFPPSVINVSNYPSVLQNPNSIAPPHQIAPPSSLLNGGAPDPEAYAKAYDMLRQRWAGREEEILKLEAVKQHQKRRLEEKSLSSSSPSLRKMASRRSSLLAQQQREAKEEEEEEEVKPLKRSKASHDNLISFFDNPPPAPSTTSVDDDGFLRPSLPLPRRSHSLSPRLPSSSSMPSLSTSPSRSPRSTSPLPRKRSVSQPCEPPRRFPVSATRRQHETSSPFTSAPFSQSAPQLPHLTTSGSSRGEALLHVVKSFEAVLACRAEGWRRLASRKSSATSFTDPSVFPPPSPSASQ